MNERFKQFRKDSQLSQVELANALGISQAAVSGMERGLQPVTDRTISQIVSTFGVSEEWLRTGEGDMYPPPSSETEGIENEILKLLSHIAVDNDDMPRKRFALTLFRLAVEMSDDQLHALKDLFDKLADSLDEKAGED